MNQGTVGERLKFILENLTDQNQIQNTVNNYQKKLDINKNIHDTAYYQNIFKELLNFI